MKKKDLVAEKATQPQIWEQFKAFHKKELHRLDLQGFLTKKTSESARKITPAEQESVNLDVAHQPSGLTSQTDALNERQAHMSTAMSVIGNNQKAFNAGVPTFIQMDPTNGNTSATRSDTATEAVCRRLLNKQQISVNKQMDAMTLRNQELEAEHQI